MTTDKFLVRLFSNTTEYYSIRDVINLIRLNPEYNTLTDLQIKKILFYILEKMCKPFIIGDIVLIDEQRNRDYKPLCKEPPSICSLTDYTYWYTI